MKYQWFLFASQDITPEMRAIRQANPHVLMNPCITPIKLRKSSQSLIQCVLFVLDYLLTFSSVDSGTHSYRTLWWSYSVVQCLVSPQRCHSIIQYYEESSNENYIGRIMVKEIMLKLIKYFVENIVCWKPV